MPVMRYRRLLLPAAVILALIGLGLRSSRVRDFVYWGWMDHEVRHAVNVPFTAALAGTPSLGSHALLGQENEHGSSPAATSPIDTQVSGSSFLVFNAGFATNTNPPTDNKGNAWKLHGSPVVYRGYGSRFDIKAYVALAARGGAGQAVSIVKNGTARGELTLAFIEIRNASVLQDVAQNYPAAGARATSASVTTTGPATLIALWWGDGPFKRNSAIPDDGFTVIENFVDLPPESAVQGVVAYRQVDHAGTYDVTWTQAPQQGAALWLFAFQAASTPDRIAPRTSE